MDFPDVGQKAATYGRRGASKSTVGQVYRIEGETVTMHEIMKRLGLSKSAARARLVKLKSATGPITWARLGA